MENKKQIHLMEKDTYHMISVMYGIKNQTK